MIKEIKIIPSTTGLQIIIDHPLDEIEEVSMFVFKLMDETEKRYLFTMPFHKWSLIVHEGEEINPVCRPGAFQQERYKEKLISAMNQVISIIH